MDASKYWGEQKALHKRSQNEPTNQPTNQPRGCGRVFGRAGHNAFGHAPNNWPVCSVSRSSVKLAKKQTYVVALMAFCGFCDKLPADQIFASKSKS